MGDKTHQLELEGCGSHSCVICAPAGQGTNGPCMCVPRVGEIMTPEARRKILTALQLLQVRKATSRATAAADVSALVSEISELAHLLGINTAAWDGTVPRAVMAVHQMQRRIQLCGVAVSKKG